MTDFTDYIADALTSHIAGSDSGDFIIRQGDDIVYVDIEDQSFFLIRVEKAHAEVPSPTERAEASRS